MLRFYEKIETRKCNSVLQSFDEKNENKQKTCKLTVCISKVPQSCPVLALCSKWRWQPKNPKLSMHAPLLETSEQKKYREVQRLVTMKYQSSLFENNPVLVTSTKKSHLPLKCLPTQQDASHAKSLQRSRVVGDLYGTGLDLGRFGNF